MRLALSYSKQRDEVINSILYWYVCTIHIVWNYMSTIDCIWLIYDTTCVSFVWKEKQIWFKALVKHVKLYSCFRSAVGSEIFVISKVQDHSIYGRLKGGTNKQTSIVGLLRTSGVWIKLELNRRLARGGHVWPCARCCINVASYNKVLCVLYVSGSG